MSEIKTIRDLVGDYYSSLNDYKHDLNQRMQGQSFIIHLPVKDTFNPLPKKVVSAFYHSIAHLALIDKRYQHFYFDKYQASNRFYLFSPGDELEISFLTVKGKLIGTSKTAVSTNGLARVASLPHDVKIKPFIIKVISKKDISEPDYQKQAEGFNQSLKRTLLDLLTEADESRTSKKRRIRLGRNNNGNITTNIITFFKSLKIDLDKDSTLDQWKQQLDHSHINWGFKDVEDLKSLLLLLQNYENQADIMQGKIGLSTVFKRVRAQGENATQDYQTMLQLIKELSQS